MRVLLLTYHYPPDRAVGALRPEKVARAFRDAGHEVVVITARLPDETAEDRLRERGLVVRTVRMWRNPRDWYLFMKRAFSSKVAHDTPNTSIGHTEGPVKEVITIPKWKRWLFSLMWLPDARQGFVPPVVRAVGQEIRQGVDLIYTTAPPFSVHLAGLLCKHLFRMTWAAEFRDPWTANPWKPWHGRSRFSDGTEKWLERKCLASADHIIAVTQGIGAGLIVGGKQGPNKHVQIVLNGIDDLHVPRPHTARSLPRRVVHVGTLYHARDPRPFFDAVRILREARGLSAADLEIVFIGNCRWFKGLSVAEEIAVRGLEDLITLRDWIPREEVQDLLLTADVLLLLAQGQPDQVPNKLYEYLGTRTPILAYTDSEGETEQMLRLAGGHFTITDDALPDQVRILAEALALTVSPLAMANESLLLEWTTSNQMNNLLRYVGGKDELG